MKDATLVTRHPGYPPYSQRTHSNPPHSERGVCLDAANIVSFSQNFSPANTFAHQSNRYVPKVKCLLRPHLCRLHPLLAVLGHKRHGLSFFQRFEAIGLFVRSPQFN